MIVTTDIFIAIPKVRNTQVKLTIDGTEETIRVEDSEWIKPATLGIGTFKLRLKNAFGQVSDKYSKGQVVKFFYDNSNASRLQFQGRIDRVREMLGSRGQFLELTGRHRSYLLTETKVNHSATGADPSNILKAIIDKLPSSYGFTKSNINDTGLTMDVEWDYKSFWDCVRELCNFSNFDCRVDNDLDFHFHKRDSIINFDEVISEGDTFIKTDAFGVDDFPEKTRVIGIGQMDDGITPIFHTAKSETEGSDIREVTARDTSANTVEKVKNLAQAKLTEELNRPSQGVFHSFGLETLEPGENMWVIIPRQKIVKLPRFIEIKIRFGSKVGGVRYQTKIEREFLGTAQIIDKALKTENLLGKAVNVNKLDFSHNFNFDNDNLTESHRQTEVNDGLLRLSDSSFNDGTWIGNKLAASKNISKVELRYIGKDLGSSVFDFSVNNGVTFTEFSGKNTLVNISLSNQGKNLKPRIKLVKDDLNPQPVADSLAVLFS